MLKVENLSFHYKSHPVLNNLSFSIGEGKVICLLGKNGAGKTTLFKCIMGFFKNYQGKITLCNTDLQSLNVRQVAQKIAYIPQAHEPTYNYLVSEIVLMGTTSLVDTFKNPSEKEMEIVSEVLSFLNISHLADRGYAKLSGGERQLVLIARALAQKSPLLIMDEPTANLDYGNQQKTMQLIKSLSKKGYTILLSTHNPEHALYYADQVFVLEKENPLLCGTPEEIITTKLLQKIYGVEAEILKTSTSWGDMPIIVPKIE